MGTTRTGGWREGKKGGPLAAQQQQQQLQQHGRRKERKRKRGGLEEKRVVRSLLLSLVRVCVCVEKLGRGPSNTQNTVELYTHTQELCVTAEEDARAHVTFI